MRIRRVILQDFFHESDNTSPTRNWTGLSIIGTGDWNILSRTLWYQKDAPGEAGTAYWTDAYVQSERVRYQVKINIKHTNAGFMCGLIFQADANAGAYLGNSRVLLLSATHVTLYPCAGDTLGAAISSTAHTHSAVNDYRIMIDYDPATGVFEIFEDDAMYDGRPDPTTSRATGTDPSPLTGNNRVGVFAHDCNCEFTLFQVQRPDSDMIVDGSVSYHKYVSKRPMTFAFAVAIDDDKSMTREFQRNDDVEIIIEDGTVAYRECYGRIEWEEWDTARGSCKFTGRDPFQQLLVQEAVYNSGGVKDNQEKIQAILSAHSDDLPGIDVKAGGNDYENVYYGRSSWDVISSLARQAGYGMWFSKDREVMVTDSYPASGVTIDSDTDPVFDACVIEDIYDLCNDNRLYSTGNVQTQADATSKATYGKRGGPLAGGSGVDLHITADAQGAEEGQFWVDMYKDPVQAVLVRVADYHELDVGMTLTLNIDQLGLTGATALCVEKHYMDGSPWFTFHCVIYSGTPLLRLNRDPTLTMSDGKQAALRANSWSSSP